MKKGERGQHLLDTGECSILGSSIDDETLEEVEKETDDQIMERIKCEENFLEEDYVEYQNENWRDIEELRIIDSILHRTYYENVLKKREAFRQAMKIILEGNPVNLSENPTVETKGPDIDDTLKKLDK
jgi:aspartate carbamoyltransferase catalytic subunit